MADPAPLADADARENWQVFLAFRDRVQAAGTLEAAWCGLYRGDVRGVPPLFLQMLTHLIARAACAGVSDAFALRAAELFWRPQRAALTQGATLLADTEYLEGQGQQGLAQALEAFIAPLLGETVQIRPVPVIEDANWTWHVGLDPEATAIANDLWQGRDVAQARLARILWLARLEFADPARVLARARERPVYLALAMDAAQQVRMKPQNLLTGLPLREDG